MKPLLRILCIPMAFLAMAYWVCPDPAITVSPMLYDKDNQLLCVNLNAQDKWRLPIEQHEIPPQFLKMLVAFEDKRFY